MIGIWSWGTFGLYVFLMLYLYFTTKKECVKKLYRGYEQNHVRSKKWSYMRLSIIPAIIAACRKIDSSGLGGSDMWFYLQTFENSTQFSFKNLNFFMSRDNPLFYFIGYLIRCVTSSEKVYFFIIYFFILAATYYFFDKTFEDKISYAPLFFLMYYFLRSFSLLKFMLGLSVLAIAYVKMKENKKIIAIVISIIAAMIHSSLVFATVMLVFYSLTTKMMKYKKWLISLIICSYAAIYIFGEYIYIFISNSEYANYLGSETSIMSHFTTIMCGLFVLILYKPLKDNHANSFLLFAVIFDLAVIPIQDKINFFRMHYIFFLPRIYMWGKIIQVFKAKVKPRRVEIIASCLVIAWTIFRFIREYEGASLMPYILDILGSNQ